MMMPFDRRGQRSAGILLHPTCLPSPYGIGDLGPSAYAWVDALADADQAWWQILPLGPTGYGDSPYQSFSAFAGNPLLISPQALIEEGLLSHEECANQLPKDRVDFGGVISFKFPLLERAWKKLQEGKAGHLRGEMERFAQEQASWLDSYCLFMAIKDARQGQPWQQWPADLVGKKPEAIARIRRELADSIGQHQFRQFLFYRQWTRLREYANSRGVKLIGDAPIFVSGDSADVWGSPEWFLLDEKHMPTVVAGVPPDYFSPTGQLWGNPLYDWEALRKDGYGWWINRLRATLTCVDVLRLDHFRGFGAAWHVPAGSETAEGGKWVPGPGIDFFEKVRDALGGLPLIAEDLGEITPDVHELRDKLDLPGMRVLHFAFEGKPENPFLPANYLPRSVVYTGTHDNNTTLEWYQTLPQHEKEFLWRYLDRPWKEGPEVVWDMIRVAWSSVAETAIVPLQDILTLGGNARMNFPGRPGGNWHWRYTAETSLEPVLGRLKDLTWLYNRAPYTPQEEA